MEYPTRTLPYDFVTLQGFVIVGERKNMPDNLYLNINFVFVPFKIEFAV